MNSSTNITEQKLSKDGKQYAWQLYFLFLDKVTKRKNLRIATIFPIFLFLDKVGKTYAWQMPQ